MRNAPVAEGARIVLAWLYRVPSLDNEARAFAYGIGGNVGSWLGIRNKYR